MALFGAAQSRVDDERYQFVARHTQSRNDIRHWPPRIIQMPCHASDSVCQDPAALRHAELSTYAASCNALPANDGSFESPLRP